MKDMVAIILAAGKGTRMRSKLPKVLHKVGGLPMLQHVLAAAAAAGAVDKLVVVGHGAQQVSQLVGEEGRIVLQEEQLGTGHAVLQTKAALQGFQGTALILCGDTPLLDGAELARFCQAHAASGNAATVLTTIMAEPQGYGRILRDGRGQVRAIVEEKDASPAERAIQEVNSGIYCIDCPLLFDILATLTCDNAQGEYYLTDVLAKLVAAGYGVGGVVCQDRDMVMGINSRRQLAEAEALLRRRTLDRLMEAGVTIMDPASTFIDASVTIAPDTVIYPYTWLEGTTSIGEDCEIGPNVRLSNVQVGDDSHLQFLYGHDCQVGSHITAGPYVHLRPDTVLHDRVKIGNFVEVKNSTVGCGTKLPHLTYIGDSDIGSSVNMGCGCITVNYDGKHKHRTTIGDNAFIGCNSNLIAPVQVGAGCYIGAGSTITKEVPDNALGIARSRQLNLEGWAEKYRSK